MIRWTNSVALFVVLTFPITSGRPITQALLRGTKLSEPEQVIVHTRMKDDGDEESQRIEIRHEVELSNLYEEPKTTRDHLYRSFSSTPERFKSGKKNKKDKSEFDSNVFSHLSSKKSKKDSKKDKLYFESKPLNTDVETASINEIIPSRNRKHLSIPIERNAPVYESTLTTMPTMMPTTTPTTTPTISPSDSNTIDNSQSIYDEIKGRLESSTRHPKRALPRPALNQHEPIPSTTAVPPSEPPTFAPVRMPTRHRNYAIPPTHTQTKEKYRGDDRRDGLNDNENLCDGKNDTIHDFPINSEIEAIDDKNDKADDNQNDASTSQNTIQDELIIEDDTSNVQNVKGTDQEPSGNTTIIENTTSMDEKEEATNEGIINNEVVNENSDSKDHNNDDTEQKAVEDEKPNEARTSNDDKEDTTDQETAIKGAAESDGTGSIDSIEKSSRSTWKNVVTGLVPSCLISICLLTLLYYRASRRKNEGFGGIQKTVDKMEKIDNTITLDQTGGSGYSRMNSIKSFQDFDDSKSEYPESSEDLDLQTHSTLPRPTGMYDTMPSHFESTSSDDSKLMFESDGDGHTGNIDNFADDDGDYDFDDIIVDDEDDEEQGDDFYVYNYDHEIEEVDFEEIDEMDMEESSSSYIEEEFLSTIDEESQSYKLSTSGSNSHRLSGSEDYRLTSW